MEGMRRNLERGVCPSCRKQKEMFLNLKYERIRSRKEETWGHSIGDNLGLLSPDMSYFSIPNFR
jgi:hypothetical protein